MLESLPPTADEAHELFGTTLTRYGAGVAAPVIPHYGFDTLSAVERVHAAAPNPPSGLLDAARAAFDSRDLNV